MAVQAETSYFKKRSDNHTNSIKQLWSNLNTVCWFKNNRSKNHLINKLKTNQANYVTKPEDISNQLNNFFPLLVKIWLKTCLQKILDKTLSSTRFFILLNKSIFVEPTNERELLKLVRKLRKSKSPGHCSPLSERS